MIEGIELSRALDLGLASDRRDLVAASRYVPGLTELVESGLDDLLRFFPDPEWRTVYSGGSVGITTGPKSKAGFDIRDLLELAVGLRHLAHYPGFEKLMAGFRNPTQVEATVFEARVAAWCNGRLEAVGLEFSPEVPVKDSIKRPEFIWHTTGGSLYCECKRASIADSAKIAARLDRLMGEVVRSYEKHGGWRSEERLDIAISSLDGNTQMHISRAIGAAASHSASGGALPKEFPSGPVTARLCLRTEERIHHPDTVFTGRAAVGPVSTRLDLATFLTLELSVARYRSTALADLFHEAKSQLPNNGACAIFIELASSPAAQAKLQHLMSVPDHQNVLMSSIWHLGQPASIFRQNSERWIETLVHPKE